MKKENIPNMLTIIRFLLIPFIYFALINKHFLTALLIFTVSAITDVLDGFIARKFNYITDIGKLMDPLADKLTQVSLLLGLCILKILPLWIFIVVFIKELALVISASVLYSKNDVVVYSKWYGKLATTLFYLAIVCSLLINEFNFAIPFRIDLYLFYLALLATVFAFVMYSIYFKFNKKES